MANIVYIYSHANGVGVDNRNGFVHSSLTLLWFLRICGQTVQRIVVLLRPLLTFVRALLSSFAGLLIGQAVSIHLQTNYWLDGAQIWWSNSMGLS